MLKNYSKQLNRIIRRAYLMPRWLWMTFFLLLWLLEGAVLIDRQKCLKAAALLVILWVVIVTRDSSKLLCWSSASLFISSICFRWASIMLVRFASSSGVMAMSAVGGTAAGAVIVESYWSRRGREKLMDVCLGRRWSWRHWYLLRLS